MLDKSRTTEFHNGEHIAPSAEFRSEVRERGKQELKERLETNPMPTEEEVEMGFFPEMLEPQVREAVIRLRQKGYDTRSSGFFGPEGSQQSISGFFKIDDQTTHRLEAMGCKVEQLSAGEDTIPFSTISYSVTAFDQEQLKQTWEAIADELPSQGDHKRNMSVGAISFRYRFAPQEARKDIQFIEQQIKDGVMTDPQKTEYEDLFERLKRGDSIMYREERIN
jgi:hypothetical protein